MNYIISGKNIDVTEGLRQAVYDKLGRLEKFFNDKDLHRMHHQLLLFGRYICKAKNPDCKNCLIKCHNQKI